MKRKQVWQYSCDFCKRKKLSASAISNHEKHCTMNPNRECRVCKMVEDDRDADFVPVPLPSLIALLPDSSAFHEAADAYGRWDEGSPYFQISDKLQDAVAEALPALRKAAGDCPACIMAALRQAKIPVPMAEKFNFTAEMKEIWDGINEDKANHDQY